MFIVTVCQEMKWNYHQYLRQPEWFVELLAEKMRADSERIKRQSSKIRKR